MALRITMGHLGGGGVGCRVRMGQFLIGVDAHDAHDALHAASGIAHNLAATINAHPELQALLPPQAQLALKAIHVAAAAAKAGNLDQVAATLAPAAAQAVSRVLRSIL